MYKCAHYLYTVVIEILNAAWIHSTVINSISWRRADIDRVIPVFASNLFLHRCPQHDTLSTYIIIIFIIIIIIIIIATQSLWLYRNGTLLPIADFA